MSYSPAKLLELKAYLTGQGAAFLGIVGDAAHKVRPSYHNGQDRIEAAGRTCANGDYTICHARDREPHLTNAAMAYDIGAVNGSFAELQKLSRWLVDQCIRRAPDTLDIREVIFSPNGLDVLHWDAPSGKVYQGGTGTGHGDDSHRGHSHLSFHRDSEQRDKLAVFKRYFEEGDVQITEINAEDWRPTGGVRRPIRATPDRATGVIVGWIEAGQIVRTIVELKSADGNIWRLTERSQDPGFLLRTDFDALVPGGDPALRAEFDAFLARAGQPPPAPDCSAAVAQAVAPLNAAIAGLEERIATMHAKGADIADD